MCLLNRKNKAFLTASELLPFLEANVFYILCLSMAAASPNDIYLLIK